MKIEKKVDVAYVLTLSSEEREQILNELPYSVIHGWTKLTELRGMLDNARLLAATVASGSREGDDVRLYGVQPQQMSDLSARDDPQEDEC